MVLLAGLGVDGQLRLAEGVVERDDNTVGRVVWAGSWRSREKVGASCRIFAWH